MTRNEILEVINNFYDIASEREVAFAREILKAKKWIGLTDEELEKFSDANLGSYDLCLEVEAKLRKKNGG